MARERGKRDSTAHGLERGGMGQQFMVHGEDQQYMVRGGGIGQQFMVQGLQVNSSWSGSERSTVYGPGVCVNSSLPSLVLRTWSVKIYFYGNYIAYQN